MGSRFLANTFLDHELAACMAELLSDGAPSNKALLPRTVYVLISKQRGHGENELEKSMGWDGVQAVAL